MEIFLNVFHNDFLLTEVLKEYIIEVIHIYSLIYGIFPERNIFGIRYDKWNHVRVIFSQCDFFKQVEAFLTEDELKIISDALVIEEAPDLRSESSLFYILKNEESPENKQLKEIVNKIANYSII